MDFHTHLCDRLLLVSLSLSFSLIYFPLLEVGEGGKVHWEEAVQEETVEAKGDVGSVAAEGRGGSLKRGQLFFFFFWTLTGLKGLGFNFGAFCAYSKVAF